MHTNQPRGFDVQLQVVRDLVTGVICAVDGLVGDRQESVDLLLVNTQGSSQGRETLVSRVSCFVNDVDVEEVDLVLEDGSRVLPKGTRVDSFHGERCLVGERGTRMPWLDLLSEDDLDFVGEFRVDNWFHVVVHSLEEFCRKRADVVEIDLESVNGMCDTAQDMSCEFWSYGHGV